MDDKYSVVVQWSDEDEGYIAIVPELKGLSAFGATPEEALKELNVAKELYLEVFEEDGCALPDPEKLVSFSGQIRLRLPKSLHAELSRSAKNEGISLNTKIVNLLSKRSSLSRIEKKIDSIKEDISYQTIVTCWDQKIEQATSNARRLSLGQPSPGTPDYNQKGFVIQQ